MLGSATPSLESRYNVDRGKYKLLQLPERVEQRPMPEVELIDMRTEFLETRKQNTFSRRLVDGDERNACEAGEQVMLLHNRRGFSTFVACRSCGERVQCVNCSVTLTLSSPRPADAVPLLRLRRACAIRSARSAGASTSTSSGSARRRVEDELHREFPEARIARMDRDTVSGKRHFETILTGFRERAYDILVGTQMIAKGHDIPNVTLVGVVSADIGLGMPDFRAAERTFQLLTQVAGRAGRGRSAWAGADPDDQSGSLRDSACRRAGLHRRSTDRNCIPASACDIRRSPRWQTSWCEARSRRTRCA